MMFVEQETLSVSQFADLLGHELIAGELPPVKGGDDFFYCGLFLQKN